VFDLIKRTRLKISYRNATWKQKTALVALSLIFLLGLSILVVGQVPKAQTYAKQDASDTYTKYYFTREECRYIFPEGSCVVDTKYCDQNSYDYQIIKLDPYIKYCKSGTIVYNDPEANKAPLITSTSSKDGECLLTVAEGEKVNLAPEGYDPDKEIGPAGRLIWTFYEPFSSQGTWQTQKGDADTKWSKVRLSDGELYDEKEFCVEVVSGNHAPVLSGLKDISAKEGETVEIAPRCTDPDGDEVTITISGFMTDAKKTLGYSDQGAQSVTVTCTDPDGAKDTQTINVTVTDQNRPPTLEVPDKITVKEGDIAKITAKATDPDGDRTEITYAKPFVADGTWKTKKGDAGTYTIVVTANDGKNTVTKPVTVIVNRVNTAPQIGGLHDMTVYEGDTVSLEPKITDAEGDQITVAYYGWMTSPVKKTGYEDAGVYDVKIVAKDAFDTTEAAIKITVLNRNRPPVITKLK
jgi:hypothetical protein